MSLVVLRTGRGLLSILRILGFRDFLDTRTCHRLPACLPAASVDGAGAFCAPEAGAEVGAEPWPQMGPANSARSRAARASSRTPAAAEH